MTEVAELQAQPRGGRRDHPRRTAGADVLGAGPAAARRRPHADRIFPACRRRRTSSCASATGSSRARPRASKPAIDACSAEAAVQPDREDGRRRPCRGRGTHCRRARRAALQRRRRLSRTRSPSILDQHSGSRATVRASRALLDALPIPVWLRAQGRAAHLGQQRLCARRRSAQPSGGARAADRALGAASTPRGGAGARPRRELRGACRSIVGGERKPHDVMVLPFEDATAAAAVDVDRPREGARRARAAERVPYDRTLDRVATAVAIFNARSSSSFFNEAYRKLWQLDAEWLKTRPTEGAVLDRLRELGRLPQVVNYREWKAKILACYGRHRLEDDTGMLPDGRTLQVHGREALRRRHHLSLRRRDRAAGAGSATTTR